MTEDKTDMNLLKTGLAGAGLATFGPAVTTGLVSTLGTASTGVAISSLTGAAATNATIAAIGGGSLAAGGGGIAAGSAVLAAMGPIGWAAALVCGITYLARQSD